MKAVVDLAQRKAKMRAHTGTHLLHAELVKIFPHTKQAGSLVNEDFLRFDFQADRALNMQEVAKIQQMINTLIYQSIPVNIEEMSYKDAISRGAKAFFEDKYGDVVRVVKIKNDDFLSIELCGGTHVNNTSEIGAFIIVSQEAVASGIRRLSAVTGPAVSEFAQDQLNIIEGYAQKLECAPRQINEKLDKLLKDTHELKNKRESVASESIRAKLREQESAFKKAGVVEGLLLESNSNIFQILDFKGVVEIATQLWPERSFLIATSEGTFALHASQDNSAKKLLGELGLKGGGNDKLVQGRDQEGIQKIFK